MYGFTVILCDRYLRNIDSEIRNYYENSYINKAAVPNLKPVAGKLVNLQMSLQETMKTSDSAKQVTALVFATFMVKDWIPIS